MSYYYEGDMILGVLSALLTSVPTGLLGLACYVLSSLALYTIANRRGIRNGWLAWVPVAKFWILGSLSDQYQYVVNGKNKSKRKSLLVLSILTTVLTAAVTVVGIVIAGRILGNLSGYYYGYESFQERRLLSELMGPVLSIVGISLPLAGMGIAFAVIRFMALYDVYKSLDPDNATLFLVLSILFNVTEAFFLFFSRQKDTGMPPRRQSAPAYIPQEPAQPGWQEENKDYL